MPHVKTILVPIDFSNVTEGVVAEAAALANLRPARIVLLNVISPPLYPYEFSDIPESIVPLIAATEKASARELARWRRELLRRGVPSRIVQMSGVPAQVILEQAEKLSADHIVIGSHGHTALYDLIAGSTTTRVLKSAPCPVVVVPAQKVSRPRVQAA
jgi:nucleotide-binding universal stress UspA family protein